MRIYVGYVREKPRAPSGTLAITHGYDGKTFAHSVPVADLAKGPVSYTTPDGAKKNEFVRMEVR